MMECAKVSRRIHTKRKTPTLVKITVAGENACQMSMRVQTSDEFMI